MPPARSKKVASSKKPAKREQSVLVISSDEDRPSSPSKKVSSSADSSINRILSVLGDGRELALAPPLDSDGVDDISPAKKGDRRQSNRVKTPSSKIKAVTEGAAVGAVPAKSRKKASAIVQPGSPLYAAVVSGMPAASWEPSPDPSPLKSKAASLPSGSQVARGSNSSRSKEGLGAASGPGMVLKALKALEDYLLPSLMADSPPVPRVSPPSVVLFADDIKNRKSRFKRRKSASPPTSPPPSSPPADTPSLKKKRMTATSIASRLPPSDDEDVPLASTLRRKGLPKTPTPASRTSHSIFIDDEAEEEDDGNDGDKSAEDEDVADDANDTGSALETDPDDDDHMSSVNDTVSGDATDETARYNETMSADGDDAVVDGDADERDGSDDSGNVSANSMVRRSKAASGPQVLRPELQDKDLTDMGVYQNVSDDLCPASGNIRVADFATCKETFNRDSIVRLCHGFFLKRIGQFVNTANCSPDMFIVPSFLICNLADTNCMAIEVMCGVCTDCSLRRPAMENNHRLHRIVVMPFGQQFLISSAVWGAMFNFQSIVGNVSKAGISFNTRWEGTSKSKEGQSNKNSSLPEAESSGRWTQELFVDSPEKPAPSTSEKAPYVYQWAQSYDTEIPIYDGHGKYGPEFLFTREHFAALYSYPRYQGDLPAESLVAVGSTLFLTKGNIRHLVGSA
ncbi:hypothetical protein ARMSODRAFT_1073688 [Armillaria solidipes]|uniref:Uncharacterized protein n=1 Tax=Armillaria solidipes TaxID=1076256 RepID=A0A2H3B5L0_9AGAR|nr:hypothetical protein ARMSODRAFT_1073688 [Armillaria solidipes]